MGGTRAKGAAFVAALALLACGGKTETGSNGESGGKGGSAGAVSSGERDCNQNLTFDDPLVEVAVRNAAGVPTGPIAQSDVVNVTFLNVEKGAHLLGGIECLHALESIAAREGTIEDLSALHQLTSLRAVSVDWNRISDLSPLSDLPLLHQIAADSNLVQSLTGLHVVLSHQCGLELHLARNLVGDADVQPFCDLGWHVSWGGADGGTVSTCNLICL